MMLDENESYIKLKFIQNLTETDLDNVNVWFQLEE